MVDLDFNAKRRDEVFSYLYEKYKDGFAHIGTHGTLQPKNSFKDVCRIFGIPFVEANQLSSLIPDDAESIDDALKDERFLSKINENKTLKEVVSYSKKLEGTIKSYGVHASFGYEAKLQTRFGPVSIGELENQTLEIFTPNGWKNARITKTGYKEIIQYKVSPSSFSKNEYCLPVTSNHSILSREFNWLEAKDFNGIFLAKKNYRVDSLDFLAGCLWRKGVFNRIEKEAYFYNHFSDEKILEYLVSNFKIKKINSSKYLIEKEYVDEISKKYGKEIVFCKNRFNPPSEKLDIESIRGWLSGFFNATIGSIKNNSIRLEFIHSDIVDFIKDKLSLFGINISSISSSLFLDYTDFYDVSFDKYNSFKLFNFLELIDDSLVEKISDISIWDTKSTKSYIGDVFDFEIFTELESERMAYVDGIICHNCISGNSKLLVDDRVLKIEDVYKKYKDSVFTIKTIKGNKRANVVNNGRKNTYRLCLYGSDKKTLIDKIEVTSDHKIYVSEFAEYVKYKDLKPDSFYLHSSITDSIPNKINDYFISGVLLPLISTDKNKLPSFNCSIELINIVNEILSYFYEGDYQKWDLFKNSISSILTNIKETCGLRSFNNVLCFNFKSTIYSNKLYENLDSFVSGLFSSLSFSDTKREKYSLFSGFKFSISIQNLIIRFLERKEIIVKFEEHELIIDEANLVRFCLYYTRIPLFVDFPSVYLLKEAFQTPVLKTVYDISIITDNESSKNYIANLFNVHNCSSFESPVITENGVRQIGSLSGSTVKLLTPNGWKDCYIWRSGRKYVNTYKLGSSLTNSEFIRFTPDHLVQNENKEWIPIGEMLSDNMAYRPPPVSSFDFLAGWLFVDGFVEYDKSIVLKASNENFELDFFYDNFLISRVANKPNTFIVKNISSNSILEKYSGSFHLSPFKGLYDTRLIDIESFRSWLSGFFSYSCNVVRGNIQLLLPYNDRNWKVLNCISRELYNFFGIKNSLIKGNFVNKEYSSILLSINPINSFKFINVIGLLQDDKTNSIKRSKVFLTYESKELEDVYEFSVLNELERENKCAYVNGHIFSNCGVILSPIPLNETVPLFASEGKPVTMYDGAVMEKLNFIKCDILGVKVLAIIDETLININKNRPEEEKIKSIYDIKLDDQDTYEMLSSGDVSTSFQLEGASIAPYVEKCKPKSIDDISAILACIRPGPLGLNLDKSLIKAMSEGEHFDFKFPKYQHLFSGSYGLGLYQEEYMLLLQEMCGFDPIKTDVWRKAVNIPLFRV